MPNEPETETAESDDIDDADVEAFATEWQAMRDKLATIPDDIGEKLDRLLNGQTTPQPGAAPRTRASRGTPSAGINASSQGQAGAPTGQPQQAQGVIPVVPDKQPKSKHWYYRDTPWKRNG